MKIDKLEKFFISETSNLLGLYELSRSNDPRIERGALDERLAPEEELLVIKQMWCMLISYAKLYKYKRFEKIDDDIESFYFKVIVGNK